MTIELEIEHESEFPLMRECVNDVREIWIKCGKPETEDGPTTEIHGFNPHTDNVGDDATEGDIDTYNCIIDNLYELVDHCHIGSGIWYTQYYTNDAWNEFETEAKGIIDTYVENNLWDEFCSSTLWEQVV